jgi:hypothetical protein
VIKIRKIGCLRWRSTVFRMLTKEAQLIYNSPIGSSTRKVKKYFYSSIYLRYFGLFTDYYEFLILNFELPQNELINEG